MALAFRAEPITLGDERYLCFGFDALALRGVDLQSLALRAEPTSGVVLHHVSLYAVPADVPDGRVSCEQMLESGVQLHVWPPGGEPLQLPDGVALRLPPDTRRLVVQAHALRIDTRPAADAAIELCPTTASVAQRAAWIRVPAPVPAIRPQSTERSTARCRFASALHVASTWPHMHQIGAEFHGAVVRADGTRSALVDVVPWRFGEQRTYPVEADLGAGDAIETTCIWRNDGTAYVFPGPGIRDEMCAQSLVVWPAAAASCAPE